MIQTMRGIIVRSTGSWYEVMSLPDKEIFACRLRGKFKIQDLKVTNPIAVGDYVEWHLEKEDEKIGMITKIETRENYIIRKSVHKTAHGHLIASNLDQAVLIATLTSPRTSLGFIDRFLVSAEAFRIPSILIFNKLDILDEDDKAYQQEIIEVYEEIGYQCFTTSVLKNIGLKEVRNLLRGKKTLLSGHSGVGKSSLLNALNPNFAIKTAEISTFANKGVHTTTFAEMLELEPDTYIIDTPGIKELGLMDISKEELSHYFPEMREMIGKCKYHNCMHLNEPNCAIRKAATETGEIALCRYESYLGILEDNDNRR
jgi:ribosome biogenesis GTPase / thiamine phosphate phosphatase